MRVFADLIINKFIVLGWKMDLAADMYWNQTGTTAPQTPKTKISNTVSISKLEKLFNAYKDEHENAILLEGTEKLCRIIISSNYI